MTRRVPVLLAALCVLACGGMPEIGANQDDGLDDDAKAGCAALEAVLTERFSAPPTRTQPGDQTCRLASNGRLRSAGLPDGALTAALSSWDPADNMAADGLDGTQFGRQRGATTCKVALFWDLVDMGTFETANERVEVACGPLDAVR
jgi:hypothetical protein